MKIVNKCENVYKMTRKMYKKFVERGEPHELANPDTLDKSGSPM